MRVGPHAIALVSVWEYADGYLQNAMSDEEKDALMLALKHGLSTAGMVAKATMDAAAATEAGIYEFDLHRAVSEANK